MASPVVTHQRTPEASTSGGARALEVAPPERHFYDVFLSYRHADAKRVGELKDKIEALGFTAFWDQLDPFKDFTQVGNDKIDAIRAILARSTCLVFFYSRATEQALKESGPDGAAEPNTKLGVWMPWELGFFDGSVSARIGVYLLDGPPANGEKEAFTGCEYLGRYRTLTDEADLAEFLRHNAVRERRIDNVESAFIWLANLTEEGLPNPANVGFGIAEWYADHTARLCTAWGAKPLADGLYVWKAWLDEARVSALAPWRNAWVDELIARGYAQQHEAARAFAAEPEAKGRPAMPATPGVSEAAQPGQPWGLTLLKPALPFAWWSQ